MIRTSHAHLIVSARTHPGMTGKNNEDRYAVSAYRLNEEESTPSVVAIVADGVGGNRAGEVAALMAVEIISQHLAASDARQPVEALVAAFQAANQAIFAQAQSDPAQSGMGTTCVCAWVIGDRLFAAWVGDSRLYLVRQNTIQRLSIDHTFVQAAVEQGVITPEEARNTPVRHVIHRYLGMPKPVELDFRMRLKPGEEDAKAQANQGFAILPGDILLLCSDGLTDMLQEADILAALLDAPLEQALDHLVDLANQNGGLDNITIVGLQASTAADGQELGQSQPQGSDQPPASTIKPASKGSRKRLVRSCLVIAVLLIFGMVALIGAPWLVDWWQGGSGTGIATASPLPAVSSTPQPSSTAFQSNTPTSPAQATVSSTPAAATATLTPWP